jgi:hypothetical protein
MNKLVIAALSTVALLSPALGDSGDAASAHSRLTRE